MCLRWQIGDILGKKELASFNVFSSKPSLIVEKPQIKEVTIAQRATIRRNAGNIHQTALPRLRAMLAIVTRPPSLDYARCWQWSPDRPPSITPDANAQERELEGKYRSDFTSQLLTPLLAYVYSKKQRTTFERG